MGDFSILGIRIRELRNFLNKTQKEFAEIVGCTAATLSAYENGSKSPSLDIVKNIAEKCSVSLDWLCGLSDKQTINEKCISYSDIVKMLLSIDKYTNISLEKKLYEIGSLNKSDGFIDYTEDEFVTLHFNNQIINEFLNDWIKMREFYLENTIDQDVYNLWIEKTLKKYNFEISNMLDTL